MLLDIITDTITEVSDLEMFPENEIIPNAINKPIFATNPLVKGHITGIGTHFCYSCNREHKMYEVTLYVGLPLKYNICPSDVIQTCNGIEWLRESMKETDDDYMFFGCRDKVNLYNYTENEELTALQQHIKALKLQCS